MSALQTGFRMCNGGICYSRERTNDVCEQRCNVIREACPLPSMWVVEMTLDRTDNTSKNTSTEVFSVYYGSGVR